MPEHMQPMSEAMYYILLALLTPSHGYHLMQTVEEVSRGRLRIGPGTLYGVLTRMLKEGLIVVVEDDGRRKTYAVTPAGREALEEEYRRLTALVEDGAILKEGTP